MADISKEIQDFREAVYGEEVRGSMISLAKKVNGEVEDNTDKVTKYGEAEQSRAEAETARVNAEKARVTAENGRVSAESNRASAENTRAENEEDRISAEEDRAEAESARANAESARVSAESGRATAESGRASAESARVTAESGRETAESGRATAEEGRVSAETDRVSSESAREEAESSRQTNTAQAIDNCDEAAERANTAAQAAEDMVAGKGLVMSTEKGAANGVATLDGNAKIPQNQIDGSNIPITFEQAAQRANIQSGDTMAEALAKLSKLYADLKPYVFSNPANNLTETDASIPLAAPQGKALSDRIGSLSSLTTSVKTSIVNAINSLKSVVDGKLSTSNVVNNLTTTASGKALDARQGKALNDKITSNASQSARIINTSWGTSVTIPKNPNTGGLAHGVVLVSGYVAFYIWAAGAEGAYQISHRIVLGGADTEGRISFSINKSSGTVTIKANETSGVVYIGA